MHIEQFFDKGLAHISYAIVSKGDMAVIDPGRDPKQYFNFAAENNAKIVAVIETHPHADFVSSHCEIARNGATIYTGKLVGVNYPHTPLEEGDLISIGKIKLKILHTPGHSPDSISIVLLDEEEKEHAVFTGDTLFIGDVGRPDLRETAGNIKAQKEMLAKAMYHSLREKLIPLPDDTIVYPAHGPGSLCGKSMSPELSSTMGQQKKENYALQPMNEDKFVQILLENQPFIPKYFPYNVELNRDGAPALNESIAKVKIISSENEIASNFLIIDSRSEKDFKEGHLKGAINIQNGGKFETWLGSIVGPEESFYLIASNSQELEEVILKSAKIGYELKIKGALAKNKFPKNETLTLDVNEFTKNLNNYTIVDIRDKNEVKENKIFEKSINVPLQELRERASEIPQDKPLVVHCAGGYRSAAGSSILDGILKTEVFDLGEKIKTFTKS